MLTTTRRTRPGVVQRLQRLDHLRRRAVRAGDDALVLADVLRVDLGDDQRHLRVHAPVAALVDHHATAPDRLGDEVAGDVVGRAGDGQIDAVERLGPEFLDRVLPTGET